MLSAILNRLLPRRSAVFVSHSTTDDKYVDSLTKIFENRRIKVFVDHDHEGGITPSEKWEERLRQELAGCEAVVLCVTPAWLGSPWCIAEYNTARLTKKPVIPLILENCDHSKIAADIQKLDVSGNLQDVERIIAIAIKRFPRRHPVLKAGVAAALLIGGLFALSFAPTELGHWGSYGPSGGIIGSLVADDGNPSILYAAARNLGDMPTALYRSDDCGASWQALDLPPQIGDVTAVHVRNGTVEIAATDKGVWRRSARDSAWKANDAGKGIDRVSVIAASPLNPDLVILGGENRSGGMSISEGIAITSSQTLPARNGTDGNLRIQRAPEDGWWTFPLKSMDDVAWSATNSRLAYVVSAENGLWVTHNGFDTIEQIKSFPGEDAISVKLSADGKALYVGTLGGLWVYDVAADSWREIEALHGLQVQKPFISEHNPATLLFPTNRGIFSARSDASLISATPTAVPGLIANGFVGCRDYVLAATAGGGTLRRRFDQEDWIVESRGMAPIVARNIVLRGDLILYASGPGLYRSVDGGQNFQFIEGSPVGSDVVAAIFPDDERKAVSPVLRHVGADGGSVEDALVLYRNSTFVVGTAIGDIWRKPRGGTELQRVFPDQEPHVAFSSDGVPEAIFSLYRHRATPNLMLATTRAGNMVRSMDLGTTWKAMTLPGSLKGVMLFDIFADQPLLSTLNNGIGFFDVDAMRFSRSGGTDEKDPITDVIVLPQGKGLLAVSIKGRVYQSGDNGKSFTSSGQLAFPGSGASNTWSQLGYWQERNEVVAGTDLGPFVSHDLGATWRPLPLGGKEADIKVTALMTDPRGDGRIVLATNRGMIRELDEFVVCADDNRCYSVARRNIAINLSALYSKARDRIATMLGF
jgi:hypothetical protein